MKKIRYYLAAFVLAATLSGPVLLGIGSGSIANAASSRHTSSVSSTFVAGKLVASKLYGPCPTGGGMDC